MNIHDTKPASTNQHSNRLVATMTTSNLTIQQQPAGSSRTKELRSHLCITIERGCRPPNYLPVTNGGGNADSPTAAVAYRPGDC